MLPERLVERECALALSAKPSTVVTVYPSAWAASIKQFVPAIPPTSTMRAPRSAVEHAEGIPPFFRSRGYWVRGRHILTPPYRVPSTVTPMSGKRNLPFPTGEIAFPGLAHTST